MATKFNEDVWLGWLNGSADIELFAQSTASVMLQSSTAKLSQLTALVVSHDIAHSSAGGKLELLTALCAHAFNAWLGKMAPMESAAQPKRLAKRRKVRRIAPDSPAPGAAEEAAILEDEEPEEHIDALVEAAPTTEAKVAPIADIATVAPVAAGTIVDAPLPAASDSGNEPEKGAELPGEAIPTEVASGEGPNEPERVAFVCTLPSLIYFADSNT